MSLINQMLKDLDERRRKQAVASNDLISDLPVVGGVKSGWKRCCNPAVAVVLLLLVVVSGATIGIVLWKKHPRPAVRPAVTLDPVRARTVKRVVARPAAEPRSRQKSPERKTSMGGKPLKQVASTKDVARSAAASSPSGKSSSKAGKRQEEGEAAMANSSPPSFPAAAAASEEEVSRHPQSDLERASSPAQSLVTERRQKSKAAFRRLPHPVTPELVAAEAFHKAMNNIGNGRLRQAESELRRALKAEPGHLRARETLASLLLRTGRVTEAATLLRRGVQLAPGFMPFRESYARILVSRGQLRQAEQTLTAGRLSSVAAEPDSFALLAAIYQRRGKYEAAASIYRKLLAFRPEEAVWWMGLGIALESGGKPGQARIAYRKALDGGALPAKLKRFVNDRLKDLR